MFSLIFFICLGFLLYFSYVDIRTKQLGNVPIFVLLLTGLVIHGFTGDLLSTGLGMLVMAVFSLSLWYCNTIGGADAKLLLAIVPFLFYSGFPHLFATILLFMGEFGILGTIYGISYTVLFRKKEREIPFIPLITFAFIVSWVFRIS